MIIKNKLSTINSIFLVVVMLELFLMGSGRAVQIGPLTLRMIFFLIAVYISIIFVLWQNKIDKRAFLLLNVFVILLMLAFLIGCFNGATMSLMLEDLKPLSFFFMILFFCSLINCDERVNLTIKTIKATALILAMTYLLFILLVLIGLIRLSPAFVAILEGGVGKDIRFRQPMGFFYNGFLYLGIGFIFYIFEKRAINKIIAILMLAAVVFTFTRGFLLSTSLVIIIYTLGRIIWSRRKLKYVLFLLLVCFIALLLVPEYLESLEDRQLSDTTRITLINQVLGAITPVSLIIGHGLGVGTDIRPVHMEISYFEIFHKQGIIGLLFWLILFGLVVFKYFQACKNGNRDKALPFVLSCLLIFIETATNNYVNNPIGMSMLLISIAVLSVLARKKQLTFVRGNTNNESMPYMQLAD